MGEEYEDYITEKAEGFRLVEPEIFLKAKEHKDLLYTLSKGNMTVKEIHEIYKLPDGKYTKTLKTVYRHLDALEQYDLIKVAGHRKYKGARSLEKLYCRTAKVFSDDESKKKEWMETEDGKRYLDALAEILYTSRDRKGDYSELRELVDQLFLKQQEHSTSLIRNMSTEKFSDIVETLSFDYIKVLLDIVPPIQAMLDDVELVEKMRKALS